MILRVHLPLGDDDQGDVTVIAQQNAVFSYVATNGPSWKVNGTDINDLPSEILGDIVTGNKMTAGHHLFTLTILARAEYNETIIQWVVDDDDKSATLFIQGIMLHETLAIFSYTPVYFYMYISLVLSL